MRLLLDTHTIIWMVTEDSKLSQPAKDAISSASEVFWSAVSLWEMAIKKSLGRLDLNLTPSWSEAMVKELEINSIQRLNIEPSHCNVLTTLPWYHRDPFDRMLIAQAKTESLTIVGKDHKTSYYDVPQIW